GPSYGAGHILDKGEAAFGGHAAERREVGGASYLVDGQYRLGARARGGGRKPWVHVERGRVYVGEHRPGAAVEDGIGRCDEAVRRDDHLVAGADPGRKQGEVQGGRAAGNGDRVRGPDPVGEGALELGDARSLGDPAAADRLGDQGDLLVAHLRFGQ